MNRPVLVDLCCGAGGASVGYHRAGFDVVGVDVHPQPRYPFRFIQADVLTFLDDLLHSSAFVRQGFAAVHASPPCQRWAARGRKRETHPDLIDPVRSALRLLGVPYVIENVPGAPLVSPVVLCGQMFDLGVYRHRAFEVSGFDLQAPYHHPHAGRVGDGRIFTVTGHSGGHGVKKTGGRFVDGGTGAEWRKAMGVDWPVTNAELVEMIPPAFSEYIGKKLIQVGAVRFR